LIFECADSPSRIRTNDQPVNSELEIPFGPFDSDTSTGNLDLIPGLAPDHRDLPHGRGAAPITLLGQTKRFDFLLDWNTQKTAINFRAGVGPYARVSDLLGGRLAVGDVVVIAQIKMDDLCAARCAA
jgi:hypothetical protein